MGFLEFIGLGLGGGGEGDRSRTDYDIGVPAVCQQSEVLYQIKVECYFVLIKSYLLEDATNGEHCVLPSTMSFFS